MAKKYYWLKLHKDFFKRHEIRVIESMDNGKDYILFYLKLLVESVSHEGNLRFSDTIPYNEQMLSSITNTNVDVVRSAMKIFKELNMIDVLDDETIYLAEVSSMIGSETNWAKYKRKEKAEIQLHNGSKILSSEQILLPDGNKRFVDDKRYGGNGMYVLDRAKGICELCGSNDNVVIHHANGYSNDKNDLICLCSKCHGLAHTQNSQILESIGNALENFQQSIEIRDIENKNNNILSDKTDTIHSIIDYLNKVCGTKYRYCEKTNKLIKARLNQNFTEDDFHTVIDKKFAEWNGTEMAKYLRPETLFGNKFEGYLNQMDAKPKEKKQNQFNNFNQRKYDFAELEKEAFY